jgi:hypothetical protein
MKWQLSLQDLYFLVDTLMPETRDRAHAASVIQRDEQIVEAMLDDERLFQRMISDDEVLVRVSPWLFFTVLLRRVRRELEKEPFTIERRDQQKVFLFDTEQVVELLQQESLQDYLAAVLASFTRVRSVTVPIRVRKGVWHKYRVSDLDVDSLVRYSETVDERLSIVTRTADNFGCGRAARCSTGGKTTRTTAAPSIAWRPNTNGPKPKAWPTCCRTCRSTLCWPRSRWPLWPNAT